MIHKKGIEKTLHKIINFIIRKPGQVLVIALILTGLLGFAMSKHKLDADLLALLPEQKQSVKNLNMLAKKFGGIGYILVCVETKDKKIEAAKQFANDLVPRIKKLKDVRYVDYRMPVNYFKDRALLYMDETDLWKIHYRLNKKIKLEKKLANPFYVDLLGETYKLDFSDIKKKYEKKSDSDQSMMEYYVGKTKDILVMIVKPNFMSAKLDRAQKLIDNIKTLVKKVNPKRYHPSLVISYGGRYQKKIDSSTILSKDLATTSVMALVLVIFVIFIYFRKWPAIFIIGVPLVMGVIWSFGLVRLVIDHINIITGFLVAILMGLGIDYGIHFLNRYFEERRQGKGVEQSIHLMLSQTGRATLTAAITTCAAFFILMIAQFKGFSEFGLFAGTGIITCFTVMYTVLPALVVLFEKWGWLHFKKVTSQKKSKRSSIYRFAGGILIVGVLFTIFSLTRMSHIPFEFDFAKLEAKGLKSYALDKKLSEVFDMTLSPSVTIAKNPAEEDAIYNAFEERRTNLNKVGAAYMYLSKTYSNLAAGNKIWINKIKFKLNKYKHHSKTWNNPALPKLKNEYRQLTDEYRICLKTTSASKKSSLNTSDVKKYQKFSAKYQHLSKTKESTIDFLNSLCRYIPKNQARKLRVMGRLSKLLKDESLKSIKGKEKQDLNELRRRVAVGPITRASLPWEIRRMFMGIDKNSKEIFMLIFNKVSLSDRNNIRRYSKEIVGLKIKQKGVMKKISASGETIIFNDILLLIEKEGLLVLILAGFAVFLIVLLDFRSLSSTLLVLLPLGIGMAWMFGLMYLLQIKFNFLNVVVLPIIIGIGIDHGVHVFHRYKEEGAGFIPFVIKRTGSAVLMASITTMIGFSALLWASHRGLNSVGSVALIGICATFIVAVTILPALLQLLEYLRRKKSPARVTVTDTSDWIHKNIEENEQGMHSIKNAPKKKVSTKIKTTAKAKTKAPGKKTGISKKNVKKKVTKKAAVKPQVKKTSKKKTVNKTAATKTTKKKSTAAKPGSKKTVKKKTSQLKSGKK